MELVVQVIRLSYRFNKGDNYESMDYILVYTICIQNISALDNSTTHIETHK